MQNTEKKIPEFLLKIIEGYSLFNKVYVKYWITLAIFSIIIIIPSETNDGKILLPFNIGTPKREDFYPLGFAIISLLIICFASTFSQAFRMSKLLYRALSKLKDEYIYNDIYLQDIVDGLIYPSLTRVAPLAQLAQGKYQFFPESNNIPRIRKFIALVYYTLLKLIAISVMHLLPASALILSFYRGVLHKNNSQILNIPVFIYWTLGISALIILTHLLIEDLIFMTKVWKRLNPYKFVKKRK